MPLTGIYVVSLVLLIFGALVFFYPRIENFFIFYPVAHFDGNPEDLDLDHEDVSFSAQDGTRLHGWFFSLHEDHPVVLFCHGNAGNISHRLENIKLLLEQDLQVFIFDYRGYGKSKGSPSEAGLYQDGLAAYDCLVQARGISPDRIILFGRSLGAAVAVHVSGKRDVRSLILESAFTSTRDMAKTMFLFRIFSPFIPAHYNNLKKLQHIPVPKLIIHGDRDELVPFSMGKKLYSFAHPPKYFLPIEGAGHNDTYGIGGRRYFQVLNTFARNSEI